MDDALPRRATLQRKLLRLLAVEPAKSAADLSRRVGAKRPSVSRALAALRDQGLVENRGRNWDATDQGRRAAAPRPPSSILDVGSAMKAILRDMPTNSVFAAGASSSLNEISRMVTAWNRESTRAMDSLALQSVRDLVKAMDFHESLTAAATVRSALASTLALDSSVLAAAQRSFLEFGQLSASGAAIGVHVARMTAGLNGIDAFLNAHRGELRDVQTGLATAAATVAKSFSVHAELVLAGDTSPRSANLLVPAESTADVVETASELSVPTGRGLAADDPEYVAVLLDRIAPRLGRMWRGAWEAARGDNPDGSRQACDGAREVLAQALDELTPKAPPGATHREKVLLIVGGESTTLAEWAVSMAEAARATYTFLVAEAHTRKEKPRLNQQGLFGHMESVGGLLRFLLTIHDE